MYVTHICRTTHGKEVIVLVMEVTFSGNSEVWPPIGLKHWKDKYKSLYLLFHTFFSLGYEKVIFVVMEVIWGHGVSDDLQLV